MNRSAQAIWNGTIKEGNGNLTTQSQILDKTPYSFVSRFENQPGTNPEELMACRLCRRFIVSGKNGYP